MDLEIDDNALQGCEVCGDKYAERIYASFSKNPVTCANCRREKLLARGVDPDAGEREKQAKIQDAILEAIDALKEKMNGRPDAVKRKDSRGR